MIKKIVLITKSTLFKGSLLVLFSTTLSNFLNYLYHLVSGRLLTPSEYGLLQGFISLSYYQAILVSAFSMSVIELIGSSAKDELNLAIRSLEKLAVKLSLIWWLLILLVFPLIKVLLRVDDFTLFFVFSLQALFSFLPVVYGSSLFARLKFLPASIVSVISTLLKLISLVIFLFLGFGVIGGLGSWVISGLATMTLGAFFVYRFWMKGKVRKISPIEKVKKLSPIGLKFLKFSILSLGANLSLTSLYSADVILSRFYLSDHLTGLYAATSNLGKIIFFAASTVLVVSFPLFVKYRQQVKKLKSIYSLSLTFCLLIAIGGSIIFYLFPELLISLLYGSQYLEATQYLFKFSLFISLVAIFDLSTKFLLALRSKFSVIVPGIIAFTQVGLIILNHQSLDTIINNSLIAIIIGVIVQLFIVLKSLDFINVSINQKDFNHRSSL